MSIRQWSKYQTNVFDAVKKLATLQRGALGIEAVAGSGKTTTVVECLKLLPVQHRAMFLAFNKHIAEELKCRVPPNAEAATINSYGFRAVRAAYGGKVQLDDWKTRLALREVVEDPEKRRRWDGVMKRLIGLKKATMFKEKKHAAGCAGATLSCTCPAQLAAMSADEVASRYDVDLPRDTEFMQAAAAVWKKVTSQTMVIDYDDQWFLPVVKNLPLPEYDWVFVDESQDLSSTQVELVKRIAPRVVYVGDPRQAIYGFRGADPEAMTKMREQLDAEVLPLSICYRCPRQVVEAAAAIIAPDVIEAAPEALEGVIDEVHVNDLSKEAAPGSWVLCRTTAPLVKECMRFIVQGVKATVKGRDIGQQLVGLIEKVGGTDIVDFTKRLDDWYATERGRLEAAQRDAQLQALEDRVETLHALSEGARTVSDVLDRIANVFKDEASTGVTFATAHRAKGLEADDVYLLCPELMPHPKCKSPWQMKQEMNLKYVAYTRAMKRLRMVTGVAKAKKVEMHRGVEGER